MFEHRNYLPTAFLFLPIAAFVGYAYLHFSNKNSPLPILLLSFAIAIIFISGIATHSRNFDWRSGESIWLDAMHKAPGHARPKQSMGYVIGMSDPQKALHYYSSGLTGYMHHPKEERVTTLANAGLIFFHLGNYENARRFFELALETDGKHKVSRFFSLQSYMKEGNWNKVIGMVDNSPDPQAFASLKAISLLHSGEYRQSLELFREIYNKNPEDQNALLNMAESLSMSGNYKKANMLYTVHFAKIADPQQIYLRLAKNHFISGDTQNASKYLHLFWKETGVEKAKLHFGNYKNNIFVPLIGINKMEQFVESEFSVYLTQFNGI